MTDIAHEIYRAHQEIEAARAEVLDQIGGMTPRQHQVLTYFVSNEGVSQTAAVGATGIDRSTLADIVRRLVDRGYLSRKRTGHDARMYSVHATDKARKAVAAVERDLSNADARALSALSDGERAKLAILLARVNRPRKERREAA